MGWERRGNHFYFYHKERIGDQVVSHYIGRGHLAYVWSLIAEIKQEELNKKASKHELERLNENRDLELDRQLDELSALTRGLLYVELMSRGFHTHKGQWRKHRER